VNVKEKRGYFRIVDFLPLIVERVEKVDIAIKRRSIKKLQRSSTKQDESYDLKPTFNIDDFVDPGMLFIAQMLTNLNSKLDRILEREIETKNKDKFGESTIVDLSASGMRFAWPNEYPVGDYLQIAFLVNLNPPKRIDLLASVSRVEANDDKKHWGRHPFRIAVQFVDMGENIIEFLVHYVFDIQRDRLKKNK